MGNTALKPQYRRLVNKQEEQEEENDRSRGLFTCGICMETNIPEEKMFKDCFHSFCLDCISKHIFYRVQEHNAQVRCPHVGCTKLLDPLSCRSILAVETFVRWCDVICKAMAIRSTHAYCPFPDCSALVLDECKGKGRMTKVQCPSCKRLFCFKCKVPWHDGYQCGRAGIRRDRDDELFNELMNKKRWKKCPKCCACVEVTTGCSVITCWCKNLFCYRCGAKHTPMHTFTCPYLWTQDFIRD